jgi:hypothetical protein
LFLTTSPIDDPSYPSYILALEIDFFRDDYYKLLWVIIHAILLFIAGADALR